MTTVVLSWKPDGQRSLSVMSLYNAHTQAVTHIRTDSSEVKSQFSARGLRPGTRFRVKAVVTTVLKDLNVTVKQSLYTGAETGSKHIWAADVYRLMINPVFLARCPHEWLANGGRCYAVRRSGLTWREAQRGCRDLAAGSHLADLEMLEELLFVSSHMLRQNNFLLLWIGLNDQQVEKNTSTRSTFGNVDCRI